MPPTDGRIIGIIPLFYFQRGEIEIVAKDVEGWLVSSEGGVTVALDTHLTPELISEGIAREFVNRIQNLRKDSGFDGGTIPARRIRPATRPARPGRITIRANDSAARDLPQ